MLWPRTFVQILCTNVFQYLNCLSFVLIGQKHSFPIIIRFFIYMYDPNLCFPKTPCLYTTLYYKKQIWLICFSWVISMSMSALSLTSVKVLFFVPSTYHKINKLCFYIILNTNWAKSLIISYVPHLLCKHRMNLQNGQAWQM